MAKCLFPMAISAAMSALFPVASSAATPMAAKLGLNVEADGNFSITLNGKPWLSGGEVQISGNSAAAGELVPSGPPTTTTGTDKFGAYKTTALGWSRRESTRESPTLMHTEFRTYPDNPSLVVFVQKFPQAVTQPAAFAAAIAAQRNATGLCRITKGSTKTAKSVKGYDAWVRKGSDFAPHPKEYCDCTGHGQCAHWEAEEHDVTIDACKAKCEGLECSCFDWVEGSGGGGGGGNHHGPGGMAAQTIFPGFDRGGALDCFSYHGVFPQMEACTLDTYKESHMGGVPLVIYDGKDPTLPMTVFSPLNQPMAHHMASSSSFFGAGVKATVETIPAGWEQMFVLSAGVGINDGMMAWGDAMLKWTGKPRADMYRDLTHSTIGFWTDNGGYYHYATGEPGCKPGNCPSYETVLPKVKAYHDSLGVPFRHWQFDSWFYPKDGGVNAGGGGGAVTNWTADPKIFPSGMVAIQEKLQVPMVMHNRQWSKISDYVKSGCQRSAAGGGADTEHCEWYKSAKAAVPTDPVNFFTWFFTQQDGWGLAMYEQDWMCTEYDDVTVLQSNISMGDLWLKGMADGAASSNRTVQYCMPYANQVLSAAAYPAVTNARATGDYFHGPDQWAVGGTSLFYWAIGILPFKDGFYSSTHKQVGGQTVGPEREPDKEALMATLSCAMVGPMDGINLLNKSRTVTACRADGYILKPDRPISTTDACFRAGRPTCHTFHTYSDVATTSAGLTIGHERVHYLFQPKLELGHGFTADMVYLNGTEDYVVYNWYTGTVAKLAPTLAVAPGYEGNSYVLVSPVVEGWAFLGEVDKYVPASTLRFGGGIVHHLRPGLTGTDDDDNAQRQRAGGAAPALTAKVQGLAGEAVRVCAAHALQLVCQTLHFRSAHRHEP